MVITKLKQNANTQFAGVGNPSLIRIGVSRQCNYRCLMCWSHSPLLMEKHEDNWKNYLIDKDLMLNIISEAHTIGFQSVLFSGFGEPFIHPNMIEFIKEAAGRKMGVIIQTNLLLADPTILARCLKGVKESSLICVNLCATNPNTYKKIHGNRRAKDFNDVVSKMELLVKNNIKVRFVFIVLKDNYHEIIKALELNNRIGTFLHLELADCVRGGGMEGMIIGTKEKRKIIKLISEIKDEHYLINSNIIDFSEQLIYQGIGRDKLRRCLIGFNFCTVDETGRVNYCFNMSTDKFFMGDLNNKSLKQIWNSKKYKLLRKQLSQGKFLEECSAYCTKSKACINSRGSNFKLRFFIDPNITRPWG